MRGKSADAFAVERIKNKDGDGKIEKREHRRGMDQQPGRARGRWRRGAHEKLHFFSSRSEQKSRLTTSTSMPNEIAAPSGQLLAAPKRLTTILEIMMPLGPPSSRGAR